MATIKLAYIGGGSTRGAGTMASFIHHRGAEFDGSEVVLIDLDPDRLALVERLAQKMARARGLDIADHFDDRPACRSRQLRRRALELPARRIRGEGAR